LGGAARVSNWVAVNDMAGLTGKIADAARSKRRNYVALASASQNSQKEAMETRFGMM
jgi:hypothetical protein